MRNNKELTIKIVNFVLRKTLGQLDVAKQYQIASRFGFKVTEKTWEPAYPEYHFSEITPPDNSAPIAPQGLDENVKPQ